MDAQDRAYRQDAAEERREREAIREFRFGEPSEEELRRCRKELEEEKQREEEERAREAEGWIGEGLATDSEEDAR